MLIMFTENSAEFVRRVCQLTSHTFNPRPRTDVDSLRF